MTRNLSLLVILLSGIFLVLLNDSCKKDENSAFEAPTVETYHLQNLTCFSAELRGEIISDGGGGITEYGAVFKENTNVLLKSSEFVCDSFTYNFRSGLLKPNTSYLAYCFAVNEVDTGRGESIAFTTPSAQIVFNPDASYNTVSDIDGNTYKTIPIGNQIWMAENLKTTRLNDGSEIYLTEDSISWERINLPNYCWFQNNDSTFKPVYGAIYNWHAVNTEKLCPVGWHVPSNEEWNILINYLGGEKLAGAKLKETGTSHWYEKNIDASNSSGFTALPGGGRNRFGIFTKIGIYGYWWTSTATEFGVLKKNIYHNDDAVYTSEIFGNYGFSVRCIKDDEGASIN